MKTIIYSLLISSVLMGLLFSKQTYDRLKESEAKITGYVQAIAVVSDSLKQYKVNDSLNAVTTEVIKLDLQSVLNVSRQYKKELDGLKLDKKRINTITTLETEAKTPIIAPVELIILKDTIQRIPCIDYKTDYVSLRGCFLNNGNFEGDIIQRDSVLIVEHIEPKKFLFIRYGTRRVAIDAVSKNPNSTLSVTHTKVYK